MITKEDITISNNNHRAPAVETQSERIPLEGNVNNETTEGVLSGGRDAHRKMSNVENEQIERLLPSGKETILAIEKEEGDHHPFVNLRINGMVIKSFIDDGSALSAIKQERMERNWEF
ncbi:Aspartic peptidase domain-containing protein [Strongyloides ratti]|uniref:Aspartic peptidase domain-containing protein n=1 Tax=Strongyloides ratti TaxID=34506 RepID=A0A090L029_STRRB|nr:Aspartic peptidase domain-containing protein [Strongyloides ratti]CEF61492.1 Aspartic peptidase domain-containing protein [Strongyloides ratti]